MKLYARLENKYSENDHVIGEVIRYYTEQEVLNEYWTYWVNRTDSFLTKDNYITGWLKVYQGWIHDDLQAYEDAQDEILATQHKILDEILAKKEQNHNNSMQEQYIHIDESGNKFYFKDRKMKIFHRNDGPAVEYADGGKTWYVDGKLHRLDGPAVEGTLVEGADGYEAWYVDNKRHRLDGPAVEGANGYKAWYVDGKELSKKAFKALTKPIELTLKDIAAKFGVDVGKIKIKK